MCNLRRIQQRLNEAARVMWENAKERMIDDFRADTFGIHRFCDFFLDHRFNQFQPALLPPERPAYNHKKLKLAGFPDDLIPERYLCEIESSLMDNPVAIPTPKTGEPHYWDRGSLNRWLSRSSVNPYTRKHLEVADTKPNPDLAKEIDQWVTIVVEEMKKIRACKTTFETKDFEEIVTKANKILSSSERKACVLK